MRSAFVVAIIFATTICVSQEAAAFAQCGGYFIAEAGAAQDRDDTVTYTHYRRLAGNVVNVHGKSAIAPYVVSSVIYRNTKPAEFEVDLKTCEALFSVLGASRR